VIVIATLQLSYSFTANLTKEDFQVTKLNELDGTEHLSEMFVGLDDEHEDGDETDDNESLRLNHIMNLYIFNIKKF